RDPANNRRGSGASGGGDRLLRYLAFVGSKSAVPSAHSFPRPGRRYLARRNTLGRLPARLLPSGPRPVASFPPVVPAPLGVGIPRWQTDVLLLPQAPRGARCLPATFGDGPKRRMGRLCQEAVRGAAASLGLRRTLYPSHRHIQQSSAL